MSDSFETVIAALWRSLGLGRAEMARPTLQIDGRTVEFALGADGSQVVISCAAGRLAPSGPRRAEQLRRLTRDGLGLLLTNQACLRLSEPSGSQLEGLALGPCRVDQIPLLRGLVEDVLQLVDVHAQTLDGAGPASSFPALPTSIQGESMIFRL